MSVAFSGRNARQPLNQSFHSIWLDEINKIVLYYLKTMPALAAQRIFWQSAIVCGKVKVEVSKLF
jgi:hypothetical protein